jgi:hypothetical protein
MSIVPKLGFEYIVWAEKAQHPIGPATADGRRVG